MKLHPLISKANKSHILLLSVGLISLFIRLWLLDKSWINPDEGAHLMDAVLVLDGKVPLVDFSSRQPLYVYATAGFLKIFGTNYSSGRLFPVVSSMLIGIVIFLIARVLFDEKVALLSSVMYWILPLEILQSSIVKTEPFAMLLTCLSLYAAVRYSKHSQGLWLILAGLVAAMGYYVRQSSLIIPITAFGFIVFIQRGRVREVLKYSGLFLAGYIGMVLLVLAFYSRFLSPSDLLTSGVNPLRFLSWAGEKLFSLPGLSLGSTNGATSQAPDFYQLYYRYLHQAIYLHLYLLIGLGLSAMTFCYYLLTHNRHKIREYITTYSILYLWVFSLFIAYAFYFYTRGFFIDYAREFLPPLVIIFSALILYYAPALGKNRALEKFIVGGMCLSVGLFFVESRYPITGMGFHASLTVVLVAIFSFVWSFESSTRRLVFLSAMVTIFGLIVVSRQPPLDAYFSGTVPSLAMIGIIYGVTWSLLEKKVKLSLPSYAKFVGLSIVLGSFVVSLSFSANLLNLAYDSVWSPQSVEETAGLLKAHTRNNDEVISGAVIWELQALRRPFQMITHPTAFIVGMSQKSRDRIRQGFKTRPPKVIILDGYTEKSYLRRLPWLMDIIEARYRLLATVGPARYPVSIYLKAERVGSADNL